MKTHLVFNFADKPEEMGQMQLVTDMPTFLSDRKDILKDATVNSEGTKLTFTKPDGTQGFAVLSTVPDDFKNA